MKKNRANRAVKTALLSTILGLGVNAAWAAEETTEEEASNDNVVVVTARKVEENIQKIPISVAVISDVDIENAGLTDVNELAQQIVGFSQEKAFGRQSDRPVIRGQSTIIGREKASYFIDGVYVAGSIQSYDLESLQRIEVIKGPQSAQYGRATFAGAVNYVTRTPDEGLTAKVKATFAQLGERRLSAYLSGDTGLDGLQFRLGVSDFTYDGDWENTLDGGPDVGGESSQSANFSLYYEIGDNTKLTLNTNLSEDDDDHYAITLQDSTYNNCFPDSSTGYYCGEVVTDLPVSIGGSLNDVVERHQYGIRRDRRQTNFKVEHEFSNESYLTYNYGNSNNDTEAGQDQSFNGTEPFALFGSSFHTFSSSETDVKSHEVRYNAKALDDNLKWSVGYYTFDQDTVSDNDPVTSDPDDLSYSYVENSALFASVGYKFSESLEATLELRSATDEFAGDVIDDYREQLGELETEFDSTTYRATLTYFMDDDSMVYFNTATGNSPGQFNIGAALSNENFDLSLVPVDEEEKTETEIGYKSQYLEGDLTFNAALYYIDWDKQTLTDTYFDSQGIPDSYLVNLGQTSVTGLELMLNYRATDNLSFNVQYSNTDAEIKEYFDSNHCALTAPDTADCENPADLRQYGDVSGNATPRSPEHEFVFSTTYANELGGGWDWFTRLDDSYESTRYAQVHNLAETGDSTKVNFQLGIESEFFKVVLWGDNVTDDDTSQGILRYRDTNSLFVFGQRGFAVTKTKPRQYGITVSYEF